MRTKKNNKDVLTFIITERNDRGFVDFIYTANNIMDYGKCIVIHEPKYFFIILEHAKYSLQFRVIIHNGTKGKLFYNDVSTKLKTKEIAVITREPETFPNDERYVDDRSTGMRIYNANWINDIEFINNLPIYTIKEINKKNITAVKNVKGRENLNG